MPAELLTYSFMLYSPFLDVVRLIWGILFDSHTLLTFHSYLKLSGLFVLALRIIVDPVGMDDRFWGASISSILGGIGESTISFWQDEIVRAIKMRM